MTLYEHLCLLWELFSSFPCFFFLMSLSKFAFTAQLLTFDAVCLSYMSNFGLFGQY